MAIPPGASTPFSPYLELSPLTRRWPELVNRSPQSHGAPLSTLKEALANLNLGALPPGDMIAPSDTPVPWTRSLGRLQRERKQEPVAKEADAKTPTAKRG